MNSIVYVVFNLYNVLTGSSREFRNSSMNIDIWYIVARRKDSFSVPS